MPDDKKPDDMILDEQNKGNQNKGQEGMLTPEQVAKLEAEGKSIVVNAPQQGEISDSFKIVMGAPPAQGAAPAEGQQIDASKLTDDQKQRLETMTKIEDKVNKGQELSDDDKALLTALGRELELEPAQEKKINISGVEHTVDQAWEIARKHFGIDEGLKITDRTKETLINDYAKAANRGTQQRVVQQRSEEQSRIQRDLDVQRSAIQTEIASVNAQKAALDSRKKALEKKAGDAITKDETKDENGAPDIEKLMRYQRKVDAQEELNEIAEQVKAVETAVNDVAQREAQLMVRSFLNTHPQFQTGEGDVFSVFQRITDGQSVTEDDRGKALELDDIFRTARSKNILPEHEFARRSKQTQGYNYSDTVQTTIRNGSGPALPALPAADKSYAAMIARFKQKLAIAPGTTTQGGGGSGASSTDMSAAQVIIKADAATLGNESDEFREKVLGF
jgi:hypothetical protein